MIREVLRLEDLLDRISGEPLSEELSANEKEFFEHLEDIKRRKDRETLVYYIGIYNEVHNSKYDDN